MLRTGQQREMQAAELSLSSELTISIQNPLPHAYADPDLKIIDSIATSISRSTSCHRYTMQMSASRI